MNPGEFFQSHGDYRDALVLATALLELSGLLPARTGDAAAVAELDLFRPLNATPTLFTVLAIFAGRRRNANARDSALAELVYGRSPLAMGNVPFRHAENTVGWM